MRPRLVHIPVLLVAAGISACLAPPTGMAPILSGDSLAVSFGQKRGQIEVGGPFAGVEFHDSRPVPARISFYYPVANSIDLSTDYWTRGDSAPLDVRIHFAGRTDTLGSASWAYRWTPYAVTFDSVGRGYSATMSYRFAADLPIVAMRLTVRNETDHETTVGIDMRLQPTLRTSHAYLTREPTRTAYLDGGASFVAAYDAADTDSAELFVLNAGAVPSPVEKGNAVAAAFAYEAVLVPGDSLVVTQLIGTGSQREGVALRRRVAQRWEDGVAAYEDGILRYVRGAHFDVNDPELRQTARLALALLRANRHYLDDAVVPMPSPAEYNFFFTHDLLLTDLGAVYFDVDRVRDDLRYVQSLVDADSILPHARYWRDSTYVIEPANSDNWNHLWAVILAASYLKHSGDTTTVLDLYPTLEKSIDLMLGNERGGLMYAERPDWWDIGHLYGPRAYLTALTIRALESWAYLQTALGSEDPGLAARLTLAERMRRTLPEALWDEKAGYLLNGLDSVRIDRHYYSGSLLAAWFDLLDAPERDALLETARRELLDERVGIRNAMPADFHLLDDVYHFLEGEVGAPYLYMNGGVWPQGNAWYALGLIAAGRVDEARAALERYQSIAGVMDSPNGQPAFYEYRNADADSRDYGAVDKPTFLWAGGWYVHVLYQLAGVRESPWNLSFSPLLPQGFEDVEYDLAVGGKTSRVSYSGEGAHFRRIRIDGTDSPSAVLVGPSSRIALERGLPAAPYLAAANCVVNGVRRTDNRRALAVDVAGFAGQEVALDVVSPARLGTIRANGATLSSASVTVTRGHGAYTTRILWRLEGKDGTITMAP